MYCPECLLPLDDDAGCTSCNAQKRAEQIDALINRLRDGEADTRRECSHAERDEDDPYPDRVMVDAQGRPHYEP